MALKIGFVDGNVFHAHDALQTLHFHHGVHEQKRVAMRQNLLNLHNIHDHFAVSVAAHPLGSDWQESRENSNYKRSEEHTSELQSRRDLVCRLLLEKKKQ